MANIFISNFQFSAAVIMLLLTMTLALTMFRRVRLQNVLNTARWLMALSTGILFLQFLLQYTLRLRDMGHIQALMLNLLMFVPAAWMLSLALLYLQKCGTGGASFHHPGERRAFQSRDDRALHEGV